MKYRYFYQTKENENREGWVAARNRAEAYAALRKQGIRPYRVVGDDPVRWQPWALGGLVVFLMGAVFALLVVVLRTDAGRAADGMMTAARRDQLKGRAEVIAQGVASGWTEVFPSLLDQYLAAYAQPGWIAIPPALTPDERDALAADLDAPAVGVAAGDAAEVRQLKAIVATMREEMRAYLRAGGTVARYLALLESRQDEEMNYRSQALETVARTPELDRDGARINMNIRLRERGLLEIGE